MPVDIWIYQRRVHARQQPAVCTIWLQKTFDPHQTFRVLTSQTPKQQSAKQPSITCALAALYDPSFSYKHLQLLSCAPLPLPATDADEETSHPAHAWHVCAQHTTLTEAAI